MTTLMAMIASDTMRASSNITVWFLIIYLTMSQFVSADNTAPEAQLIKQILQSNVKAFGLTLDAESWLSFYNNETKKWVTADTPSKLHAVMDGMTPTKYRLDYSPYVGAFQDKRSDFLEQNKSISCNGTQLVTLIMSNTDIKGNSVPIKTARIEENRGKLAPSDAIVTGVAFTIELLREAIGDDLNNGLLKIEKSTETTGELKGCVKFTFSGVWGNRLKCIWLDPARSLSMRRFEIVNTDDKGRELNPLIRYDVSAVASLGPNLPYYPTKMTFESYDVKGTPIQKIAVDIKSIKADAGAPLDSVFEIPLEPGILVRDLRLGISYRVGDLEQNRKRIIRAIQKEKGGNDNAP